MEGGRAGLGLCGVGRVAWVRDGVGWVGWVG